MEITLAAAARPSRPRGAWLQWAFACLVGWLLSSSGLIYLPEPYATLQAIALFGTAGAAHLLIWYKAFSRSAEAADISEPFWLAAVSALWTFGLLLFQVLCLLL